MRATVAICTWNRADLLDRTLAEMQRVRIPIGLQWEILVVNNNCTDHTDDVIAKYKRVLPIRRLFEPDQGLSNARNCAVEAAKGDVLIWTDDDVLVDECWLEEYCRAAVEYPAVSFFGGRIEPWFDGTPPAWLKAAWQRVDVAYATCNLGEECLNFARGKTPFGANFAVRTEVQRRYPYDPSRGRIAREMLSGEETAVVSAMLSDGLSGRWLPEARVRHFIPRHRQTVHYLRSYYEGHGIMMARESGPMTTVKLLGRPRWLWRAWITSEIQFRVRRVTSRPEVWIEDLKRAAVLRGMFGARPKH